MCIENLTSFIPSEFSIHRLNIRFTPGERIQMEYWIGAVLRNRFLHAAEKVCDKYGKSLRDLLDVFPLSEQHPYYKQFAGGFAKGFLFDCSLLPFDKPGFILEQDRIYMVTLILIGDCSKYYGLFVESLRQMFREGFGHPMKPLSIVDICEVDGEENSTLLYSGNADFLHDLSEPIYFGNYTYLMQEATDTITVKLHFKTPVNLINTSKKIKKGESGYQNKMNGFPSFYQFMRSLMFRLTTLQLFYFHPEAIIDKQEMEERIEKFISPATRVQLLNAEIQYEKRYSSPRQEEDSVYVMSGYTGTLVFNEVDICFLPLLTFASHLGVGNDIHFGFGMFEIAWKY